MNKISLLLASVVICGSALAQDVKKKIDEHAKDPKTKENAAKADVFIQKKRIIADSSATYHSANNTINKKASTTVKKKKASKKNCSPKSTK